MWQKGSTSRNVKIRAYLMDEHILLTVVPIDEPVPTFDVEPFDNSGDFVS